MEHEGFLGPQLLRNRANIAALGTILNGVLARLDAGRPTDVNPFPDHNDFKPSCTRAEEQIMNETRLL